jgi:hypothetical protein
MGGAEVEDIMLSRGVGQYQYVAYRQNHKSSCCGLLRGLPNIARPLSQHISSPTKTMSPKASHNVNRTT